MTEQELKETICRLFLDNDLGFPLSAETKLLDEGICDSLGLVQLVAEIESRHPDIRIQDQEITRDNFGTISAILRLIEDKRRAK